MTLQEATQLIAGGVNKETQLWADLGAGTGMFTQALGNLLVSGTIFAVDKNPHALWSLPRIPNVEIVVEEADFTKPMERLPMLDGIIMANALHYVQEPENTLIQILSHLKPGGSFILIEYETSKPVIPWIPFPIPFQKFQELAKQVGLDALRILGQIPSNYGYDGIYGAVAKKPT